MATTLGAKPLLSRVIQMHPSWASNGLALWKTPSNRLMWSAISLGPAFSTKVPLGVVREPGNEERIGWENMTFSSWKPNPTPAAHTLRTQPSRYDSTGTRYDFLPGQTCGRTIIWLWFTNQKKIFLGWFPNPNHHEIMGRPRPDDSPRNLHRLMQWSQTLHGQEPYGMGQIDWLSKTNGLRPPAKHLIQLEPESLFSTICDSLWQSVISVQLPGLPPWLLHMESWRWLHQNVQCLRLGTSPQDLCHPRVPSPWSHGFPIPDGAATDTEKYGEIQRKTRVTSN